MKGGSTMEPAGSRRPAVAGLFYPDRPADLAADVRDLLAHAPETECVSPKALIVPHAGYVYSGEVAARAYARLRASATRVRRVVMLGPAHRVPVAGLALPDADAFESPLGRVPLDVASMRDVVALPQVAVSAAAHAREHALEVQLPFLQTVLGEFSLVPLLVGDASAADVAEVIDFLWDGDETLIVVSSDLSHYHAYAEAQSIDACTARDIMAGAREIAADEACGATPINGLMRCVRAHGLVPELLDLRNSGDTAGDRSRVVGYASFAFTP
jgi:MEMO1 family protein